MCISSDAVYSNNHTKSEVKKKAFHLKFIYT